MRCGARSGRWQALIGNILDSCITDAGRGSSGSLVIEPVIGHLKEHHGMDRNELSRS